MKNELTEEQLNRYNRHIIMSDISKDGQLKLTNSHVVIFGIGGLGSPVSLYLTASGIGKITLVDFDKVDTSNLQRQIVHREKNVGQYKVDSAKQNLTELNNLAEINTITEKLSEKDATKLIKTADIVIGCTDNFTSRFILNRICYKLKTPLIYGAVANWEGQLSTYDFRKKAVPCYQCLYKEVKEPKEEKNTTINGVLSPAVGMIGSMQAIEAIKALLNLETLSEKLLIIDSYTMQFKKLNLNQDKNCPVCSGLSKKQPQTTS